MAYTEEQIAQLCKMRKEGFSCERIAKEMGFTKNVALALVYKHYLKINRHYHYKKGEGTGLVDRELRPTVVYVPGLTDTKFYVINRRAI